MSIVKMKYIQTIADKNHYKEMLITGANSNYLHGELASNWIDVENGDTVLVEDTLYNDTLNQIHNLCHMAGYQIKPKEQFKKYTVEEIQAFLVDFERIFKTVCEVNDAVSLNADDGVALEKLREIGFEAMNQCRYVTFGFGRMPNESMKKLDLHDQSKYEMVELHKSNIYTWVAYVTSNTFVKEVKRIFDSLYFEEIKIPIIDTHRILVEYADAVDDMVAFLKYRYDLMKLYKYVGVVDGNYVLAGFVSEQDVRAYKALFQHIDVVFQEKDVNEVSNLKPPTKLKNNWFTRPFEIFINMYGLPGYWDMDPTTFVCLTYCLLFGIMFGDFGQGFVLFLLGTLLELKNPKMLLAGVISRVGIASMIFGFLFGSFFGNEELFNPVHQTLFGVKDKLFHVMDGSSTMILLSSAILIGAVLILISMLINMYLHIKHKAYGELLFSPNGITGFILYGYIFYGLLGMFMFQYQAFTKLNLILFLGIPALIFLMKEPLVHLVKGKAIRPKHGWGAYFTEAIFEVFEIFLSYITNSMSYLRVGGFVLSHAGMMLVVMTLVEMTGKSGLLVMIIGNIFVIGLEGLIVGIQTLRLQYYEMFSRYYSGGGKEFKLISKDI